MKNAADRPIYDFLDCAETHIKQIELSKEKDFQDHWGFGEKVDFTKFSQLLCCNWLGIVYAF